jgi:hypothetical protein
LNLDHLDLPLLANESDRQVIIDQHVVVLAKDRVPDNGGDHTPVQQQNFKVEKWVQRHLLVQHCLHTGHHIQKCHFLLAVNVVPVAVMLGVLCSLQKVAIGFVLWIQHGQHFSCLVQHH